MKRILGIIISILICSTSIYAQKKKSVARNNLKNMVVYEQKFDKQSDKLLKDSEAAFDSEGNTIEEIEYENGKVKKHVKYEYNEGGKIEKEIEFNSTGKPLFTTEYDYNDNDQKIRETIFNSAGKPCKIIEYKYDGDLKTEKIVYDENKKVKSKKTYQYQTY